MPFSLSQKGIWTDIWDSWFKSLRELQVPAVPFYHSPSVERFKYEEFTGIWLTSIQDKNVEER